MAIAMDSIAKYEKRCDSYYEVSLNPQRKSMQSSGTTSNVCEQSRTASCSKIVSQHNNNHYKI